MKTQTAQEQADELVPKDRVEFAKFCVALMIHALDPTKVQKEYDFTFLMFGLGSQLLRETCEARMETFRKEGVEEFNDDTVLEG